MTNPNSDLLGRESTFPTAGIAPESFVNFVASGRKSTLGPKDSRILC